MAEEPKGKAVQENSTQEYQVIQEKIVPRWKNRIKRRLLSAIFTVVMAVVFGLVAQLTFLLAGEPLKRLLGIEESGRQEVNLPTPTVRPTPRPTSTPTPVPTARPTLRPTEAVISPSAGDGTPVPTTPPEGQQTPEPTAPLKGQQTPVPTTELGTLTPEPTKAGEEDPSQGDQNKGNSMQGNVSGDWYSYAMFYEKIVALAAEASKSIVTIEAVETGIDWFREPYETRTSMTGLILANDGVDLLILTGNDKLSSANMVEVRMGDGIVEGRLFASDSDYGLAVVAVALDSIPEQVLEEVRLGKIASESQIRIGSPVIALGAPNGYDGSMEFGMITSLGSSVSVTDGQVSYFTTNLTDYAQGYGFFINLDGEVLGMITHTHKVNVNDGVSSAISLDAVRGIIVKLLNVSDMAYFGIRGEDLPMAVQQASGVSEGVYVREVENASPALAAGIKSGDLLISAGGNALGGIRDFTNVLLASGEKELLTVTLLRTTGEGVREIMVEVMLTKKNGK